jgi:hypothetical protein
MTNSNYELYSFGRKCNISSSQTPFLICSSPIHACLVCTLWRTLPELLKPQPGLPKKFILLCYAPTILTWDQRRNFVIIMFVFLTFFSFFLHLLLSQAGELENSCIACFESVVRTFPSFLSFFQRMLSRNVFRPPPPPPPFFALANFLK